MENLENQDLIPALDTISQQKMPTVDEIPPLVEAAVPQTEEAAAAEDAFLTADNPVSERETVADAQPPKYEWDCTAVPPQNDPPHIPASTDSPAAAPAPKRRIFLKIVACVLVVALIGTGCFLTAAALNHYWSAQNQILQQQISALQSKADRLQAQIQSTPGINNGNNNGNNGSSGGSVNTGNNNALTPSQVYAENVDAVVTITTNIASGSGFILTDDGYVVTNHHVIENATQVTVALSNSSSYSAKIVGYDSTHDVAVLKVDATDLPHVVLGSSDALMVGDQITVIGNPLGELNYTQTVGYISGKDRGVSTTNVMINMLQTDASINSGNSGGPMFNMQGQVVGIITAKYSGTSSSGASIEGVGFAIPIDDVVKKIYDLIEFGYISGPYLGVTVRDMDSSVSQSFGIPMGAYVVTVEKANCAFAAGVREKDIIIGLGEHTISSLSDLTSALQNFKPGDSTIIKVWRSGSVYEFSITLDDRPH